MSSADRPYQCHICRRRFASSGSVKRHYETDHYTPPRCSKCGKTLRPHESHYYGCA